MVLNPQIRVELSGLGALLTPVIANFVIPRLQSFRVLQQVSMLAPSLEALDGLETIIEGLEDDADESFLVGNELDPEVLDVGSHFAVLLNE